MGMEGRRRGVRHLTCPVLLERDYNGCMKMAESLCLLLLLFSKSFLGHNVS